MPLRQRSPRTSSVCSTWLSFRTSVRNEASARFNSPDPFTGIAPSHPTARLARAEAQLTSRGGLLEPPSLLQALAQLDSCLERTELLLHPPDLAAEAAAAAAAAAAEAAAEAAETADVSAPLSLSTLQEQ
jgi:hypothetical protein